MDTVGGWEEAEVMAQPWVVSRWEIDSAGFLLALRLVSFSER